MAKCAKAKAKVAEANAHVPGYVPPLVSTYGGHIPLCTTSWIAPTFVRITTVIRHAPRWAVYTTNFALFTFIIKHNS